MSKGSFMDKKKFYESIFKDGYFNSEVLIMILEDIAESNTYRGNLGGDDTILIDKKGISLEYWQWEDDIDSPSGYSEKVTTKRVDWEDMVWDFFDDLERK